MNSYERLFNRMEGRKVDQIPNLNIIMAFAAKYANIPYSKFCLEPQFMVEANIRCHSKFGIDAVTVMSDPYAETHDFGAEIEYPYDSNPICRKPLLQHYSDVKLLKVRDIGNSFRMLNRIKTIDIYNTTLKKNCPIIGWVEGAFAEFIDLRGINESMMDITDEPEFVKEVMEICTEQAILFAEAQIKAGADVIGIGDAAASLVGGKIYENLILPYEKRIIQFIQSKGAKTKLHICGNIRPIISSIHKTESNIIDLDWMVDLKTVCDTFRGKASISGNYDPVGILMNGDIDTIKRTVVNCIHDGDERSIISAGCEVPANTPEENLLAVSQVLREYGGE